MRHLGIFVILAVFVTTFTFPNVFSGESAYALNSVQEQTQNLSSESSLGPTQYQPTLQKSNAELNTSNIESSNQVSNLGSTDSFDPYATPYFQTQSSVASGTTSIVIQNHWMQNVVYEVFYDDHTDSDFCPAEYSCDFEVVDARYITISASDNNGFRIWANNNGGFITATGASASEFSTLVKIPDMRYFTTKAEGDEAGDYFFQSFFYNSDVISLPDDSFDISTITKVGHNFFRWFNSYGSLESLPEGSFNTSNIVETGSYFFGSFNQNGALSSLPRYSFNFDALNVPSSELGSAFFTWFNYAGSLTSLPYNSFDLSNVSVQSNGDSFLEFNSNGRITKELSGISIKNIANVAQSFYWYDSGSNSNESVASGDTFSYYNSDPPVTYTMSFDSNGGSAVSLITTLQSETFTQPTITPTKSGYVFIKWLNDDGTPYDWSTTATSDLTLTAEWELPEFANIPYLQAQFISSDSVATTFTITNLWSDPIIIEVKSNEIDLVTYTLDSTEATYTFSADNDYPIDLTISATNKDGFRTWLWRTSGLIKTDGDNSAQTISFSYLAHLNYFTTDSTGTEGGDHFFRGFCRETKATSLPNGSFNTSNIKVLANDAFENFNYLGSLTSLPAGSFNFDSLETHGDYFANWFNNSGSLTSLPAGSFNMNNVEISEPVHSWSGFNLHGKLIKSDSGIAIKNTSSASQTFYWADESGVDSGSQVIASGETFVSYAINQFDEIPYFKTDVGPSFGPSEFVTVFNKWTSDIIAVYTNTAGSVLINTTIQPGNAVIFNSVGQKGDITISATSKDGFREWIDSSSAFITTSGTLSAFANLVHIPDIRYFTTDSTGTQAGDNFFQAFFKESEATSLPPGSFDISTITKVGDNFFANFAELSNFSSLPEGSFNTSNIRETGNNFFSYFAALSLLTSLPEGSFNISNITNAGNDFFSFFAQWAVLPSLPGGSFNFSKITHAGNDFFTEFAVSSSLNSFPKGSFDTSNITTAGNNFFYAFAQSTYSLTSLPEGSFNISKITSASDSFFSSFAEMSALTSLPKNSFDTSKITTAGIYFFGYFTENGSLTSLPEGSFDTSNITTAGDYFFFRFNSTGKLTSLPVGSFNFDALTTHGDWAFHAFNSSGSLTSLPYNSFNLKNVNISSSDYNSWDDFNYEGRLTKSDFGIAIRNTSNNTQIFYWAASPNTSSGNINIDSDSSFTAYASDPYITNISPKTVQNSKATSITLSGYNLQGSYSFRITSTRFGDSNLPNASKTYSQVFPSSSILAKTYSSATLKIPSTVGWVGPYTIELLLENGAVPSKTFITYQLPLGTASKFTDISKLTPTRQANVKWLARTGVTGGCNTKGTKYCPADPVNRGSMAVFLQLLSGYPAGTSKTSSFADVFSGSLKTITYVSDSKTTKEKVSALSEKRIAAVNWLALTGITGGSGSAKVNGKIVQTYRPQDPVNRGSMATFMLRFSEDVASTITTDGGTGFADVKIGSGNFTITYKGAKKGEKVAKVTATRATAIRWMYDWGITGGSGTDKKGNLTYRAQDPVNRGSMATFMKNLALHMNFTS